MNGSARRRITVWTGAAVSSCMCSALFAAKPTTRPAGLDTLPPALVPQVRKAMSNGLRYLTSTQREDGGWAGPTGESHVAITALAAKCLIQDTDHGPSHPAVRKAVRFVLAARQPDGSFSTSGPRNYTTSVCLMMLSALTDDASLKPKIAAARAFLKGNQFTEGDRDANGNAIGLEHPWYGGAGHGGPKRPDLSNTQLMLEALHQSGLPPDDPVFVKALKFIARCQMCGDTNDQAFAGAARDGGFIYSPANGGESKAGTDVGFGGKIVPRSYGSMTYAGFKSMLYADVDRNDRRVQLAYKWIRTHYTLDENPNMPGTQSREGLYYYYHVFAKALSAWGEPVVPDMAGVEHRWRRDLCQKLIRLQREDGSWINGADRWYEGNPALATAYALLALQTALR